MLDLFQPFICAHSATLGERNQRTVSVVLEISVRGKQNYDAFVVARSLSLCLFFFFVASKSFRTTTRPKQYI